MNDLLNNNTKPQNIEDFYHMIFNIIGEFGNMINIQTLFGDKGYVGNIRAKLRQRIDEIA